MRYFTCGLYLDTNIINFPNNGLMLCLIIEFNILVSMLRIFSWQKEYANGYKLYIYSTIFIYVVLIDRGIIIYFRSFYLYFFFNP